MLDLDGTLYVGPKMMDDTQAFLAFLREKQIPHIYVTNNSSKSAVEYRDKLVSRGIEVTDNQVLTSGDSTIRYLLKHTDYRRVFLSGTPSLENDFIKAGFILTEENPQCVVMGFDTGITYHKMEMAGHFLFQGLPYYATQPDITCITERGLTPDTGVFLAGLKVMTGRDPIITGKPAAPMVEAALERLGFPDSHTLAMVGDQLDTDITMGVTNKLISCLMLSGETSREKADAFHLKPDYIFDHIGKLFDFFRDHY